MLARGLPRASSIVRQRADASSDVLRRSGRRGDCGARRDA
jgi:hypothetical protein